MSDLNAGNFGRKCVFQKFFTLWLNAYHAKIEENAAFMRASVLHQAQLKLRLTVMRCITATCSKEVKRGKKKTFKTLDFKISATVTIQSTYEVTTGRNISPMAIITNVPRRMEILCRYSQNRAGTVLELVSGIVIINLIFNAICSQRNYELACEHAKKRYLGYYFGKMKIACDIQQNRREQDRVAQKWHTTSVTRHYWR
ncbi:hypothetical protein HDU76_013942, partial [Blyttiomyces sp. JEL0837]